MFRSIAVGITVMLPSLIEAASPANFRDLAGQLVTIMNATVSLLISAGIVIYFWGAVKHIFDHGYSEDSSEMRKFLLMGIVVIFVMVSIWGILAVLQNSLGWGSSQYQTF
jgi:succinate dehydrogenase hydrophobic anchor subunit